MKSSSCQILPPWALQPRPPKYPPPLRLLAKTTPTARSLNQHRPRQLHCHRSRNRQPFVTFWVWQSASDRTFLAGKRTTTSICDTCGANIHDLSPFNSINYIWFVFVCFYFVRYICVSRSPFLFSFFTFFVFLCHHFVHPLCSTPRSPHSPSFPHSYLTLSVFLYYGLFRTMFCSSGSADCTPKTDNVGGVARTAVTVAR